MHARQLLLRAGQLSPAARDRLQHDTAAELVSRVGPAPPGAPDWAVLAAVVAERGRRALASARPAGPPADERPFPRPPDAPIGSDPTTPPPEPSAPSGGFAPPG
jgi:hypothetical protein